MDIKSRDKNWLSSIDTLFNDEVTISDTVGMGHSSEIKNNLKYLLKKRLRIWWGKATLEKYLSKNLIPRGLRVRILPSFPVEDLDFRTKWEQVCDTCSKDLIRLLIEINQSSLVSVEKEIENNQTKLNEILSTLSMESFKLEVDKQFLIWEKEVQEQKVKKFQRDLQDYQLKRVYRWQGTTQNKGHHRRSIASTSISSTEDESETYNLRSNTNDRFGKRKYVGKGFVQKKTPHLPDTKLKP
ncbi:uncharacterized protein ACNLHF_011142 [Anomaloglossus baeobatrachus]